MQSENSVVTPEQEAYMARFAEIEHGIHDPYKILLGPSPHLARIVSATAATGDIFQIAKPLRGPNMTYKIELHIPVLKCENSSSAVARNTTAAAVIAAGEGGTSSVPFDFGALDMSQLEYHNDSGHVSSGYVWPPMSIGYFAMIPQDDERMTRPWDGPGANYYSTETVMNQLWIVIADHDDDNSTNPLFLTCTLWNASLFLNTSYRDDVQSVQPESFTYINEVELITFMEDFPAKTVNIAALIYTAFF